MSSLPTLQSGARIAPIVPTSIEEVFRLATAYHKSGIAPRGMETPEKLTIAIMHGMEIGLPPMQAIQRIAVVNGRPALWGDAIPALLLARGFRLREWHEGAADARTAHCEVTRPDGAQGVRTFSVADARKAGLWGKSGPWMQYPDRMLSMRARGFAARDIAGDALSGLYLAEEAEDMPMKDITPRKSAALSKRDGTTETFNEIRADIASAATVELLEHIIETRREELDGMPAKWEQMIQDDYDARKQQLLASVVKLPTGPASETVQEAA